MLHRLLEVAEAVVPATAEPSYLDVSIGSSSTTLLVGF